jgi:endoglucanase
LYRGGDRNIATPRPSFPVNSSAPGTDVWAASSASLAMAALLYSNATYSPFAASRQPSNPSLSNTTYSAQLLDHATRLYNVANTTRQASFATSVPAAATAYGSSGWGDDMTLAALSLAIATNSSRYYADAYRWYGRYRLSGSSLVYNWDSKTPAVYVLFVEAARANPGLAQGAGLGVNLTGWQNEAENYFDRVISGRTSNTFRTPGKSDCGTRALGLISAAGLQMWRGDSDFASLNPAMAFTMLLLKYAPMATSIDKSNQYTVSLYARMVLRSSLSRRHR